MFQKHYFTGNILVSFYHQACLTSFLYTPTKSSPILIYQQDQGHYRRPNNFSDGTSLQIKICYNAIEVNLSQRASNV